MKSKAYIRDIKLPGLQPYQQKQQQIKPQKIPYLARTLPRLHERPIKNGREGWTPEETGNVIEMWEAGDDIESIADAMGRTVGSVEGKINRERKKGKTRRRRSNEWTEEEDRILIKKRMEGKTLEQAAAEMHRSYSSVFRHSKALKEERRL